MYEAVTESLYGLFMGIMSGTVAFFIVMILALVYRYFTLEKLSSFLGIVFGLGFLGFSGGLLAMLDEPTFGGVIRILVVVIFAVWGTNIGDKIAEKIPKRSSAILSGRFGRKELFTKVKLPSSDSILDMPNRNRISDSVKADLSEREFILPADLPTRDVSQWLKRRLLTDWGIGDAEIEVDQEGKITHLAVSAKTEGLSSILSKGDVALPVECRTIPSGLIAGDVVKIFLSSGDVIDEAEVIGVNNSQNVLTIIASSDWIAKMRGNKADFLIALPRLSQKKTISVLQESGVVETFKTEKIYGALMEKDIDEGIAKNIVAQVENRLLKIDGPVTTDLIKSLILEELEKTSPEEAKKIRSPRFWSL